MTLAKDPVRRKEIADAQRERLKNNPKMNRTEQMHTFKAEVSRTVNFGMRFVSAAIVQARLNSNHYWITQNAGYEIDLTPEQRAHLAIIQDRMIHWKKEGEELLEILRKYSTLPKVPTPSLVRRNTSRKRQKPLQGDEKSTQG